jgi:hypothetical protein
MSHRPVRLWPAILAALILLTGCTPPWDRDRPDALPSRTPPPSTMERVEPGDHLTVTAGVATVFSDHVFVVRDVDLPEQGLLVLSPVPTQLEPPDLVTATGVIRLFRYAELKGPFWLGDPAPYRPFEERKVLLATDVRSQA